MLAKLFSFKGRLTRLEFLGWSVAAIVAIWLTTTFLVATAIIQFKAAGGGLGTILIVLLTGLAMCVALIWSGLALAVKRIRDTGYSPLLVIGALILYDIVDVLVLTYFIPMRAFRPFDQYTIVGGIVHLVYFAALVLLPSEGADAPEPSSSDPPSRSRAAAAPPPRPSRSPAGGPRRHFGLRTQ
jgi:uncharacterized membrane protein YhaH (DUF805 family)